MGKIRVQDLARTIGMEDQDLIFKLRSIGVRVEGADALVETEILKAVLDGKKLAAPAKSSSGTKSQHRARLRHDVPAPPGRRTPAYPPRPPRPRSQIISTDPRIPTIPARPRPDKAATPAVAETAEVVETPIVAETATETPQAEAVQPKATKPKAPAPAPSKPKAKEKGKKGRRPSGPKEQDLHAYIGKIDEDKIDEVVEQVEAVQKAAGRRARRADRKEAARTGTPAVAAPTEGSVTIVQGMTVRDFSEKLGIKSKDLIKQLYC